jgi:eukaryotic-like serine/threonine-protein kinase
MAEPTSGHDDTAIATDAVDGAAGVTTPGAPGGAGMAQGDLVAGRYRITRFLGGGGMGNVYAAVDAELGESCAIKMLRRGLTDAAAQRFRTEVRLQRRITHKNVARIFDIGEHAGEKLLTMELVDGESLAARLARMGKLPLAELRAIALDILAGLAAAHAAGVVHLDLKPGNVLLARDGRAVIADFGIARANADQDGEIAGTPLYMAPEQHAGESNLDARTDLFAFGVMLYELATGTRPFTGAHLFELEAQKAVGVDPTPLAAHVPPAVIAVIQRCLAPARDDRPASADELIAALDRALRGVAGGSGVIALPVPGHTAPAATVAVLPATAAPGDEYLASGLAEDLADSLSRSPGLRVLPATAVRGMTATGVDAGAALGVDHVVESSIRRKSADVLRVAVRLVSVRDGFQVWADRRDTPQAELLATGDALADGLAGALSTEAAKTAPETIDPRAVDLYLRARHALRDFWSHSIEQTIEQLEAAAQAAPSSPTILATLATARVRAWMLVSSNASESVARAACDRAMALGPTHGEARYARAQLRLNTGDFAGGAHDLGAAIAMAPLHADAHHTAGQILAEIGQVDEGRRRMQNAMELDPLVRAMVEADLARVDALGGDWDGAERRLAGLAATDSQHARRLAALFRARLAGWQGRRDAVTLDVADPAAKPTFVVDTLTRGVQKIVATGEVHAPEWHALFDEMAAPHRPVRGKAMWMQILAEVAMANGRPDLARYALERTAAIGLIDITWLERCPLWRPITGEPWFAAVVAQTATRAQQVATGYRAGLAGR